MLSVIVSRRELETPDLPQLCICCGQPATATIKKRWSWIPYWTILVVLLTNIVGWFFVRKYMIQIRAQLPMCRWHARIARLPVTLLRLGLLFLLFTWVVGNFLPAGTFRRSSTFQYRQVVLSSLGIYVVSLIFAQYLSGRLVRFKGVTTDYNSAILAGVDPKFATFLIIHRHQKIIGAKRKNRYYDEDEDGLL